MVHLRRWQPNIKPDHVGRGDGRLWPQLQPQKVFRFPVGQESEHVRDAHEISASSSRIFILCSLTGL